MCITQADYATYDWSRSWSTQPGSPFCKVLGLTEGRDNTHNHNLGNYGTRREARTEGSQDTHFSSGFTFLVLPLKKGGCPGFFATANATRVTRFVFQSAQNGIAIYEKVRSPAR